MRSEQNTEKPETAIDPDFQLVNGTTLLRRLFPEQCRPTTRWLQTQVRRKSIPSTKIGHLRFFIPAAVRTSLEKTTTHARGGRGQ
jgi:hypothetical protein